MKKNTWVFIKFFLSFIVLALFIGKLYDIGIHRPPLKYANIPDPTISYINHISKTAKGQSIKHTAIGPFECNNKEDYGYKESEKWATEEDENFVVYYIRDKDATWQAYAQEVLVNARENIPLLEDLFGKYFYAADMNDRRLSIYIPPTHDLYRETVCELMNNPNYRTEGISGLAIMEIGPLGCLTKGIVLNPSCFDVMPNEANGFSTVLKHEMTHYVFFTALDYSQDIKHYLWVSEGIAEYFANSHRKSYVQGQDSVQFIKSRCFLNAEFPRERNSSYWAGESFFRYLESSGGGNTVLQFVQDCYSMPTDSIFGTMGIDAENAHMEWVRMLDSYTHEEVQKDQYMEKPEI